MSSGRRLPAAALSTLFFAMHTGAFRLGVNTAGERCRGRGHTSVTCYLDYIRIPGGACLVVFATYIDASVDSLPLR